MGRQGSDRAIGPYKHGNMWRIVIVGAGGDRVTRAYPSEREATEVRDEYNARSGARSIGDAVTAYLDSLRASVRPSSVTTLGHRLCALLRLPGEDCLLAHLNAARAARCYSLRAGEVAPATHHGELAAASRFAAWCVKRNWLRLNPFEAISPVGKPGRGKPQLRVDEARKLLGVLEGDASPEATAVMVSLLMGLRAHEVVGRVVRDLDDGGRLLWIPESKTRAGVRQVAIPSLLAPRLLELGAGRGPEERLFAGMTRYGLHYHTVKYAEMAGVPRVTPHGLRGTFATLAITSGVAGTEAVARTIGHADAGATLRRHYLAPGAEQSANVRSLERLITPQIPHPEGNRIDPEVSTSQDGLVTGTIEVVTNPEKEIPAVPVLTANELN